MKKLLPLLFAVVLFSSCSTMSYIQADQPLTVTAVGQKNDSMFYVEAYGLDQKRKKLWVYFETRTRYEVGDPIYFTEK